MSRKSRDATLDDVVELMTRHHIKRIPVIEGAKLVGIVTRSDILRALLRVLPAPGLIAVDDEHIRKDIVAELTAQPWAGAGMLRVSVNNGIARLEGAILDERERQAAIVAAENVAGVKAVRDRMFWVEPMSGMGA